MPGAAKRLDETGQFVLLQRGLFATLKGRHEDKREEREREIEKGDSDVAHVCLLAILRFRAENRKNSSRRVALLISLLPPPP